MNSDERILELPQPIIDRLREVIGRIRRLQWIKGSLLTLAAAVAAALGIMAVDLAFALEAVPLRLGLSLAGLAFTMWVGWNYWLRPLCRRISLTAVARWVETRHPELQERISTAVELLDAKHGAQDQGSRELLQAVVQEAVADVGRLDPAEELSARRVRPAKWLAGSAVAALLAVAALWPNQVPRLLARALAPMADVGNAWADRLRVLTTSHTMAIGDPLAIEVAVRGRRDRVELQMTGPDGKTLVEMLTPDPRVAVQEGESGYALRIPAVRDGFTARVVSGKAASAAFTIKAVPRPETGSLTVAYHYPDYARLPDEVKTNASGEIVALAGTRVTVSAPLNRTVSKASVTIGGTEIPDVKPGSDPGSPTITWSSVLPPNLDAFWSLHLEDADGIANRPVELPIRSLTDLPPVITLETPVEDRLELRPVEKVALTYSVKEDIGLSAVQIRIRPQGKPEYLLPPEVLPEKRLDSPDEYHGTAVLDLAKVFAPDGQEIRVSLMAADRVPAELQGPQRAWSREIVIKLNRWSQPLVEKNFQAQHQELRHKMEEVKRELQHAKGRMNDKADRLRQEDKLSANTLKDIENSTSHMEEAQSLMKELTERMKDTAYARQTPDLQNIAEAMVQPAQEQAQNIPLTDQKEARSELAKNSRELLEQAIQKLEEEQRQMDQDRESVQQAAQLSDIAEQQQRLAREAAAAASSPTTPSAATTAQNEAPAPQDNPAANPDNPAAEAPPSAASDPSQTAAANPDPPPAASPTDEEQRQWLEEQRRIAERAKQLMQQNLNSNPQALQDQLKQAADQAAQLAAAAEALSAKENELAAGIAAAPLPEQRQENAAAQQDLAAQAASLQEKAKGFQQASAKQIDQSAETQEAAYQAQSKLEEATSQAQQSGQELAMAAAAPPAVSTPAPGPESSPPPSANPQGNPPASPESKPDQPGTPSPGEPAAGSPAATAESGEPSPAAPTPPGTDPSSPSATAASAPDGGQPDPAGSPPPPAGKQAAQESAQSLAAAAESLRALGKELDALAGMVAEHNKSLGEGAQQAGTAAEQAGKSQQEQGKSPSMQQGAPAAQQAADQLSVAANTVMQAMSIPASAKSSQPAPPSPGKGKPQDGQPKPDGQPGQEGKEGLQMDVASSLLPEELARLGFSQDDWMKLRSALTGVEGTRGEQIPEEYRELVKAYFGALAKGGNAK